MFKIFGRNRKGEHIDYSDFIGYGDKPRAELKDICSTIYSATNINDLNSKLNNLLSNGENSQVVWYNTYDDITKENTPPKEGNIVKFDNMGQQIKTSISLNNGKGVFVFLPVLYNSSLDSFSDIWINKKHTICTPFQNNTLLSEYFKQLAEPSKNDVDIICSDSESKNYGIQTGIKGDCPVYWPIAYNIYGKHCLVYPPNVDKNWLVSLEWLQYQFLSENGEYYNDNETTPIKLFVHKFVIQKEFGE